MTLLPFWECHFWTPPKPLQEVTAVHWRWTRPLSSVTLPGLHAGEVVMTVEDRSLFKKTKQLNREICKLSTWGQWLKRIKPVIAFKTCSHSTTETSAWEDWPVSYTVLVCGRSDCTNVFFSPHLTCTILVIVYLFTWPIKTARIATVCITSVCNRPLYFQLHITIVYVCEGERMRVCAHVYERARARESTQERETDLAERARAKESERLMSSDWPLATVDYTPIP